MECVYAAKFGRHVVSNDACLSTHFLASVKWNVIEGRRGTGKGVVGEPGERGQEETQRAICEGRLEREV